MCQVLSGSGDTIPCPHEALGERLTQMGKSEGFLEKVMLELRALG